MSKPSREERHASIHEGAMIEFDTIQSAMREERLQCLQDRRFYSLAGAQWEGDFGEQFANKPKLEINKIHLAVIRIINEYRNNRVTVDFTPMDGSPSDALAEACDDLYRATEQRSVAEEAYDNAFEEAVGGGFGAFRLRTEYEDDEDPDDEKQRICIEPIYDADSSVFYDLNAKRQDKADAKRCFVLTAMSPDAYKEEWGDDPASWPKEAQGRQFDWAAPDVVYVAEYYCIEEKSETIIIFKGLNGEDARAKLTDLEDPENDLATRLDATGFREERRKKLKVRRVHKYVLSGSKILEDCGYIAGRCIPIIPVYGKRWYVDDVERCMGHVRLAKDAQRLMNMLRSKLAEISAIGSVSKPIVTPEQIAGHGVMWSEDNIKNNPYLLLNPMTDANGNQVASGPIAYTKSPEIPPALAMLMQIVEQDVKDLTGNQEAGEEIQPNISGKAIELIQNRLDMQSFIYLSNFSKAVKRGGEVWLSMAKDIFVEEGRKLKGISVQGEARPIEILRKELSPNGEAVAQNDFTNASFDVAVNVGPSSDSRRAATVRALTGMISITDDPETKQVLGAMAMMNMEGEGIADVRDFFRMKLLRMGVIKPSDEEAKELAQEQANAKPDANEKYLEAAAQQADADAKAANSKTVLNIKQAEESETRAEKNRADAVKVISDIDVQEVTAAIAVVQGLAGDDAKTI